MSVPIALPVPAHAPDVAAGRAPGPDSRDGVPPLRARGVYGYDALKPVVVAALATEAPLLRTCPHGTAKSWLLLRLAEALGLSSRHYHASLLNYDDLVCYPVPDAASGLRFVEKSASIWGAEVVFLDEILRCRRSASASGTGGSTCSTRGDTRALRSTLQQWGGSTGPRSPAVATTYPWTWTPSWQCAAVHSLTPLRTALDTAVSSPHERGRPPPPRMM